MGEEFVEIEDYELFCDESVLRKKMECNKTVKCDGGCCGEYNALGPYCILSEQWESACLCRSKQMECGDRCKCDPSQCKNRAIQQRKEKKMVREQDVFGLDQQTRMYLDS